MFNFYEPIGLMAQPVCLTCGMVLIIEGKVSRTGTAWVRYPCDSCRGEGTYKIEIQVVKPLEFRPDNSAATSTRNDHG